MNHLLVLPLLLPLAGGVLALLARGLPAERAIGAAVSVGQLAVAVALCLLADGQG